MITFQLFSAVALIMFLEVMGLYFGSTLFWAVTLTAYSLAIIILSFILYFSPQLDTQVQNTSHLSGCTILLFTWFGSVR